MSGQGEPSSDDHHPGWDESSLDGITDPTQLRAMLVGRGDTIAEQRRTIETLRAEIAADQRLHKQRAQLEQLSPNHRIYRESEPNRREECALLLGETDIMRRTLAKAPPVYAVSEFWETFFKYNMNALTGAGLSNLKLTVNQNYQNYIPRSFADPKVRVLTEWFLANPSVRPLLATITSPDGLAGSGYLAQPGTEIFPDQEQMALYRALVTLGWEYVAMKIGKQLAEPELGNPIRVSYEGKLISQDLATSVSELSDFVAPLLPRIDGRAFGMLEIGGGYGRLAHAALSTLPVSRYVIVDIPPALHVSRWYLEKLFPEKTIFPFRPFERWSDISVEAEKADILFFLSHQIEQLPDNFVDLSVAVSSLHEMRLVLANTYLQQMGRLSRHLIGSKQYYRYENPYDDIVIGHDDYVYPDDFERVSSVSDRLNPTFFVDVFGRRAGDG